MHEEHPAPSLQRLRRSGDKEGAGGVPEGRVEHPFGEQCEEEGVLSSSISTLEPVLFAFTIEFVLIGQLSFMGHYLPKQNANLQKYIFLITFLV